MHVLVSFSSQLNKIQTYLWKSQLGDFPDQIGLWPCLWKTVLIIDWHGRGMGGSPPLCMVSSQGRWAWLYKKASWAQPWEGASQCEAFLHSFLPLLLLEFPSWSAWILSLCCASVSEIKPFLPVAFGLSTLTKQHESELEQNVSDLPVLI